MRNYVFLVSTACHKIAKHPDLEFIQNINVVCCYTGHSIQGNRDNTALRRNLFKICSKYHQFRFMSVVQVPNNAEVIEVIKLCSFAL